jgi:GTP cyclohydrolase I
MTSMSSAHRSKREVAATADSPDPMRAPQGDPMKLVDWLAEQVTSDPRALGWFEEQGSDERIARAFKELLSGYETDVGSILKTTRLLAPDERPGLVEVKGIVFHSICAHHFLPFFGEVDVAYVPGDRILGLGKLPRLVDACSRRFQIQEDLVRDVAQGMMEHGHARGVRVRARGQHLCMSGRGPSNPTAITHTEFALGTLAES